MSAVASHLLLFFKNILLASSLFFSIPEEDIRYKYKNLQYGGISISNSIWRYYNADMQ